MQMRAAAGIPPTMVAARLGTDLETLTALERGDVMALPEALEISRIVSAYGRMVGIDPGIALHRIHTSRGTVPPSERARSEQAYPTQPIVRSPTSAASGGWIAPDTNGPGLSRADERFTRIPKQHATQDPAPVPSVATDANAARLDRHREVLPPIPVAMPFHAPERARPHDMIGQYPASTAHGLTPPPPTPAQQPPARHFAPPPAYSPVPPASRAPAQRVQQPAHAASPRLHTQPPPASHVMSAAAITPLSPVNPLQPPERTPRPVPLYEGPEMAEPIEVAAKVRRHPARLAMKYVTAPMLLVAGLWYTVQNPSTVHAALARLPEPLPRIAQTGMEIVLINTAPTKDGLRMISTRDPRSRKADKLAVRREAAK